MKIFNRLILYSMISFSALTIDTFAQDIIEIQPLFEYPSAPEELATLEEKSDYLVEHFGIQWILNQKARLIKML